jgi:hypothetical protein
MHEKGINGIKSYRNPRFDINVMTIINLRQWHHLVTKMVTEFLTPSRLRLEVCYSPTSKT